MTTYQKRGRCYIWLVWFQELLPPLTNQDYHQKLHSELVTLKSLHQHQTSHHSRFDSVMSLWVSHLRRSKQECLVPRDTRSSFPSLRHRKSDKTNNEDKNNSRESVHRASGFCPDVRHTALPRQTMVNGELPGPHEILSRVRIATTGGICGGIGARKKFLCREHYR